MMATRVRRAGRAALLAALALAALALGGPQAAGTARAADDGYTGLIVYGDTVRGAAGLAPEDLPLLACVLSNRFPQGSQIVWRVRVIDPQTGMALDDSALESVTLTLPDGSTKNLAYAPRPRGQNTDAFWAGSFNVPEDYPTGSFSYQIAATALDGRTGALMPFNVAPSMVQIVAQGSR